MKVNRKNIGVAVLIFVLLCLSIICILISSAKNESIRETANAKSENENIQEIDEYEYAYMGYSDDYCLQTQNIIIPFIVNSKTVISDFEYENNGFNILSVNKTDTNKIEFNLQCCLESDEYNLRVNISMSSGIRLQANLYAVYNECGIFVSGFSKDDALEKYLNYALSAEIIDETTADEYRMENYKDSVIETRDTLSGMSIINNNELLASGSSGDTYIQGILQWKDDDNNIHPLRRIQVSVYDSNLVGATLLGTVYTNNQGEYSLTFTNDTSIFENGGRDLYIRVYAGDENAHVYKSNGSTEYYWESGHEDNQNVATGSTTEISTTFTMTSDLGKAMQISQAIMTAKDYAWNMTGTEPTSVKIIYPIGNICSYVRSTKEINITGNSAAHSRYPNSYASWDAIMHEYGHHIQYEMGIIDSPGGSHYSSENDADVRENKSEGIRLAWGESWPTVFAFIAQKYFSSYLTNIAEVNDAQYEAHNGLEYNVETNDICLGEACERSIMSVLWDLFDSGYETNDSISLSYQDWWNVTTGSQAKTFSDFIQYFYQQYPDYKDDIGKNLSYYQMAPTGVATSTSSTVLTDTPPKFVWDPQGGSTLYPNNSFQIMIFSEDYANSITTTTINSATMTITDNNWNDILSWVGEVIHVTVIGYQTTTPATGGYYSIYKDFTKPIFKTNIKSDNTIEIIGTYCDVLGELEIPSSFNDIPVSGIAAQAFRSRNLTSVSLPSTVQYIAKNAFQYCYNLTHVYMSSTSVSRIEEYTFDSCPITYISFPSGINYIGNRAFRNTDNIGNIPKSVTYIGPYAFANSNLTAIIIPMTLTNIDTYAFSGCTSLSVYTEQTSRPSTWNSNWNPTNRPVVWGCTLSSDKSYVVSFTKSSGNPTGANAISNLANPLRSGYTFSNWYTKGEDNSTTNYSALSDVPNNSLVYISWSKSSCIAAGSLITLADGSQVAVENLTGNENLLVWNMLTGQYDTAPILFIDSDPLSSYEIIKLTFSDNTEVKVIDEHAFFDMTIGKYVFMRNDASQYIGHYFNKQGINGTYTTVQLLNVTVYNETTTAWSPVTYGHLCYYVNGMLSMPGATEGLINIFDVDTTLMKYDSVQMAADIQTYGLYTYEEFNAIIPLPELVFNAFNGQYLKVSIGKGLITLDEIVALLERYAAFFE